MQQQIQNSQQQLQAVASVASALRLPKAELATYDGDPLRYWTFIRAFENTVEKTTMDANERLTRLLQYCVGDAKQVIECCATMDPVIGYGEARRLLKERFGDEYTISTAWINKVTKGPNIKGADRLILRKFSDELKSCEAILKSMGHLSEVNTQDNLVQIVSRLPLFMKSKWLKEAGKIRRERKRLPNLKDVSDFVRIAAEEANDPVFGRIMDTKQDKSRNSERTNNKSNHHSPARGATFTTQKEGGGQTSNNVNSEEHCSLCNNNHTLFHCKIFKESSYDDRIKHVREKRLCDNCLSFGHFASSCPRKNSCKVNGCDRRHVTLLHRPLKKKAVSDSYVKEQAVKSETESQAAQNGYANIGSCNLNGAGNARTSLPIVPVLVKGVGQSRAIETYALLDGGSDTTFCDQQLIDQLGLRGEEASLSLTTLEKESSQSQTVVVSLEMTDLNGENFIELPMVYSRPRLPISLDNLPQQKDVDRWPHLQGIYLPHSNCKGVSLLIGSNIPEALEPQEVRKGNGGPYATRTRLGWTLNGPLSGSSGNRATVNFVRADTELSAQVERYFNMEFNDSISEDKVGMSVEDRRALTKMEESVEFKDGHYFIGLPWKSSPPCLPYNRPLAENRLNSLKRRFSKDPGLFGKYSSVIDEYLTKSYARKIPIEELNSRDITWYLPHHPVFHPKKPNKLRVVFDCAAKHRGVSLNDQLLQGPDLTNSLVGVLTRFRQEPVAVMADIEAMFNQVRVNPADCNALRFLWWPENNLSKEPEDYQMLVHLFGATSSPSCANFSLRRTAADNKAEFQEEAVRTVERNFYVDDCLRSVETERKAIGLAAELRALLSKGGFRLAKWISNSRAVVESIPEGERAAGVKSLEFEGSTVEGALGMQWNIESDRFEFQVVVKDLPFTRRGMLSIISSIYDPLGFVSPFVLPAKRLLQEQSRKKLSWDEPVSEEDLSKWKRWLEETPKIGDFSAERCLKPTGFGEVIQTQVHHFSDASESGYGAVSYLRLVNAKRAVHCAFLMAKSRVAPLKVMTIPRMELSAAVVAVRLDKLMRGELDLPIHESVFWTDSTSVLKYIASESKRFHTFVANRVSIIRDGSNPDQWRYVETKQNPADEASRGVQADEFLSNHRWLKGPDFLWQDEETWPKAPPGMGNLEEDDTEVKKEAHTLMVVKNSGHTDVMNRIFERYSCWNKLKKSIAWMLRAKRMLLNRSRERQGIKVPSVPEDKITVDEMRTAEQDIIKYVQSDSFKKEINVLRSSQEKPEDAGSEEDKKQKTGRNGTRRFIKKTSEISKLDPLLVDGLLRVGGRLRFSPISNERKNQIILPKNHPVTVLIARHFHNVSGHSGREHVLSLIREKFWIVKARSVVRKVVSNCPSCALKKASVGKQKMASLPWDRVTPDKPPFSYVGTDYFGPFLIRRGRVMVKRYGCIFTCLTIRAVHIEVAHSLDTHSFINALQRFMSRRGKPEIIRSDNGTNFTGAEKEMRDALAEWNQQRIHEFLLQKDVKWVFNPPASSHMGGVWERNLRTIRKVLASLMQEQTLDDEGFATLMTQVEGIINSRPITTCSDDPKDDSPLTPNHLLLLRSNSSLPPGVFTPSDVYSRRRWRQVQYLADQFWRRWVREYLPSLQCRQKWYNPVRNICKGDVVLIADEKTPRNSWPLGRVLEVHVGRDGLVRSADVKTQTSVLTRPIHKLCLLEMSDTSDNK